MTTVVSNKKVKTKVLSDADSLAEANGIGWKRVLKKVKKVERNNDSRIEKGTATYEKVIKYVGAWNNKSRNPDDTSKEMLRQIRENA